MQYVVCSTLVCIKHNLGYMRNVCMRNIQLLEMLMAAVLLLMVLGLVMRLLSKQWLALHNGYVKTFQFKLYEGLGSSGRASVLRFRVIVVECISVW